MAFHVACPITCRRICFCSLGFPRSLQRTNNPTSGFLEDVAVLGDFLSENKRKEDTTIQVVVPKVVPPPPEIVPVSGDVLNDESASMKAKRVALQRKGAAAMIAAEEYARKFESGDLLDTSGNVNGEEQGQSNVKVFCRMCNRVENEGSEKAKKMLSCKSCSKKYHRSCLKSWSNNRDLFHWSSWTCRACRICEACRRTGDPSKFMFCKRCDGAYHCYCLQPPHKNVSTGPYLCPKHTKCHSCASNVPGNGLSVRWFLGYTCCDACGRLFVKGNYCPVCLKVYRDSESTPMVCCDHCQRWVHCQCDNISDERYHQFQVDGNLQYTCPTCRGECYQVKNLEDAVQELWRRKNIADKDLITSLRAAAGLPTQEEIFSISPYSDDEDGGTLKIKSDSARSFKFSFKNFSNNSPTKMKDYGKRSSTKKTSKKKDSLSFMTGKIDAHHSYEGHCFDDDKNDDMQSQRNEGPDVYSSPATGSLSQTEVPYPVNQPGILKRKFVDEVMGSDEERKPRVVRIKSNKSNILDSEEESGKRGDKTQNVKGKKLVINLGARKINVASSPLSDNASFQRDKDLVTANGNENPAHLTKGNKFALDRHDGTARHIDGKGSRVDSGQSKHLKVSGREGNMIKLGKVKPGVSEFNFTSGRGNMSDGCEVGPLERSHIMRGKRSTHGMADQAGLDATSRGERTYLAKQSEGSSDVYDETHDNNHTPSHSLPKDSKPLLRFKFKRPSIESQSSSHQEEKTTVKGQRSKRKRPSPFKEISLFNNSEGVSQSPGDTVNDEIMDANWILMKLGNDAIGKRVEVHQTSENSWHKGEVTDIVEGTSKLHVTYDDGKVSIVELMKQGVRFVPQKQKRSKS
ncbi:RING/FYVE/PHD-type zinc finger family protein [Trifolium repens]|nr:RING/FYVE/PHD-type zinc finger family protein [Trifolium repens]